MRPTTPASPKMARHKRDDVTVKIASAVYRKAKMVAAWRDVTLAEYLTELLDRPVERDYQRMREAMDSDEAKRKGTEE